jgi:hypothetical protein
VSSGFSSRSWREPAERLLTLVGESLAQSLDVVVGHGRTLAQQGLPQGEVEGEEM